MPQTIRDPEPTAPEPTTWYELRVVDEASEPLPGIEVAFAVAGEHATATTNSAGVARLEGVAASFGSARLVSASNVREVLEPRWEVLRPVRIPDGDHVTRQPLRDSLSAITLQSETPHTLAIVPHHRRVRLVGMHFDTNKCFLLPSAMRGIRRVKEIYDDVETAEILVVGHTDHRGDRSYNENLSLERAEAVVAFMKDDVDAWNNWFSAPQSEKRWGNRGSTRCSLFCPRASRPSQATQTPP